MNIEWKPDLYLKFRDERTQPSRDLVHRIELEAPQQIIDIGCGPGNSTRVLRERWPDARVVGIDNSEQMIEKARAENPDHEWMLSDVNELPATPAYDLAFSNAVIQWIPDHPQLIAHLLSMVKPGGALAVQVPLWRDMPIRAVIAQTAANSHWSSRFRARDRRFTILTMEEYYDTVSTTARSVAMWRTFYVHEMESHEQIIEMMRGTGLRVYLEQLETEDEQQQFMADVLAGIREVYGVQKNGHVLYPFDRLFFVAYL